MDGVSTESRQTTSNPWEWGIRSEQGQLEVSFEDKCGFSAKAKVESFPGRKSHSDKD